MIDVDDKGRRKSESYTRERDRRGRWGKERDKRERIRR